MVKIYKVSIPVASEIPDSEGAVVWCIGSRLDEAKTMLDINSTGSFINSDYVLIEAVHVELYETLDDEEDLQYAYETTDNVALSRVKYTGMVLSIAGKSLLIP